MTAKDDLAKLHFINSLFADVTGNDLYLAKQVKAAIEASIDTKAPPQLHNQSFHNAAVHLLENHFQKRPAHGFHHWDASRYDHGFSPLWARNEFISIFKKLAPCPRATVVVTNLRASICPPGKRWSRQVRQEYTEAIRFIQELARTWSTRRANVTLLFL